MIVKTIGEFEDYKSRIASDYKEETVEFSEDIPLEYPCLVKYIVADTLIESEEDEENDLDEMEDDNILILNEEEIKKVFFFFIYPKELIQLLAYSDKIKLKEK